jgi:hypothetical protein
MFAFEVLTRWQIVAGIQSGSDLPQFINGYVAVTVEDRFLPQGTGAFEERSS